MSYNQGGIGSKISYGLIRPLYREDRFRDTSQNSRKGAIGKLF